MIDEQHLAGQPIGADKASTRPIPSIKSRRWPLIVLSGVLLALSFPPSPLGPLAFIAFVPFFMLFEEIVTMGRAIRTAYAVFVVFNILSLYWIGGFTHMKDPFLLLAGTATALGHPLFALFVIPPFILVKRQFGSRFAVWSFPFLYVAYEFLHSLTEYAFPWLLMGNTQTYDLASIQFASITGVYGISFWVILTNVLVFDTAKVFIARGWSLRSPGFIARSLVILLLHLVPRLWGVAQLSAKYEPPSPESIVRISAIQPDVDPFDKWSNAAEEQIALHDSMTSAVAGSRPDLVLWPETAIPERLMHPNHSDDLNRLHQIADRAQTNILTGMVYSVYYPDSATAPASSKTSMSGVRYDDYNASMLLRPGVDSVKIYSKIKLVPYAERVPYSDVLTFLNVFRWNLGIGGWGIGKDTTIFYVTNGHGRRTGFASFVCYESIFPGFDASFVRKGAEFLTVITNDSWWGNTSGAYQHKQIAALRAIENRRWVVQCANGGISCFIDPFGRIVSNTGMYERATLSGSVEARNDLTFYTRHGDWFAELMLISALLLIAAGLGSSFYKRTRNAL